jgi:hypothetical protein
MESMRGARDRGGVDAVVTIQIAPRARLAEVVHAERELWDAERAAQKGQRVGVPVEHGHHWHALLVRGDQVEYVGLRSAYAPVQ